MLTRSTLFSSSPIRSLFFYSVTLSCQSRSFVQGAPPPPRKPPKKRTWQEEQDRVEALGRKGEEDYKRRLEAEQEWYALHEPGKPAPLPENTFIKGKFGMRRRVKTIKRKDRIDLHKVSEAIDEGINAMRK